MFSYSGASVFSLGIKLQYLFPARVRLGFHARASSDGAPPCPGATGHAGGGRVAVCSGWGWGLLLSMKVVDTKRRLNA